MMRDGCGSYLGIRLHQVAGEHLCGACLERRLTTEYIPFRPTPGPPRPAPGMLPITREQARANRAELADALGVRDHYQGDWL